MEGGSTVEISITLGSNFLPSSGEFSVFFNLTNSGQSNFAIRPLAQSGNLQIYNTLSGKWVDSTAVWSELPKLEAEMKLRLIGAAKKTEVWFEIQESGSGQVHSSEKFSVWTSGALEGYTQSLTENINSWETGKFEGVGRLVSNPVNGGHIKAQDVEKNPGLIILYLTAIAAIFTPVVVMVYKKWLRKVLK